MNLLIFVSDRCNMSCDYCFLSLNQGRAAVLDAGAALAAVRGFFRDAGPEGRVTLLGGEPLLHFERALAVAEAVRSESRGRARASLVTNATLACPEKLRALQALGVEVTVSLDGTPPVHDRHRRLLRAGGSGPSLEEARRALEACDRAALRANMVLCRDTAGALLENIESLRALGLRRVSFHPDARGEWDAQGLASLAAALGRLPAYLTATGGTLELAHLSTFSAAVAEHEDDDLILGADGRYYPCDGIFARPYSELGDYACGDAAGGPDRRRLESLRARARREIHRLLGGRPHYTCPREAYFLSLVHGRDPSAAVRGFFEADTLMGRALEDLHAGRVA